MIQQRLTLAGMDLDTDEHLLAPGSTGPNLNVRLYNPLTQATGVAETLPGHLELDAALPDTGTSEVIGGCEAPHLSAVFYFVWNSLGRHCICRLDYRTRAATRLLEWVGLDFARENRISSATVVEQTLFWTDFRSEPRKLDLADLAARPALYAALPSTEPQFISLLRRAPQYPLTASIGYDAARGEQQLLPRRSLQFTYRYVYAQGEPSAYADWSAALPFKPTRPYNNAVTLAVPTAETVPALVRSIEVVVREGDTGAARLLYTLPRAALLGAAAFTYYGDVLGDGVDTAALTKPYDYVPRRSRALSYADNRLELAGNVEGYDRGQVSLALGLQTDSLAGPAPATGIYQLRARFASVLLENNTSGSGSLGPQGGIYFGYVQLVSGTHQQADARYRIVNTRGFFGLGAPVGFEEGPYAYTTTRQAQTYQAPGISPGSYQAYYTVDSQPLTRGSLDYARPVLTYADIQAEAEQIYQWARAYLLLLQGAAAAAISDDHSLEMGVVSGFQLQAGIGEQAYLRALRPGGLHRIGVQYYDAQGRTPGVARGHAPVRSSGDLDWLEGGARWPQGESTQNFATGHTWRLTAAAPPAWAASYALVRTPDLGAASFLRGICCDGGYGGKDKDGVYALESRQYGVGYSHTFLDISNFVRQGQGYSYAAGDRVRVWARAQTLTPLDQGPKSRLAAGDGQLTAHDVEIVAVVGAYLVVPLLNIGSRNETAYDKPPLSQRQDVPPLRAGIEIYTPYAAAETQPYYVASPRYPVVFVDGVRAHGVTTGVLPGDAYLVERRDFLAVGSAAVAARAAQAGDLVRTFFNWPYYQPVVPVQNPSDAQLQIAASPVRRYAVTPYGASLLGLYVVMNPDPDQPFAWDRGWGRITAEVTTAREEDRFAAIRFSNVFTQGVATNGLSSFEPLNEGLMPREHGPIRRLQPVGANLLAVGELGAEAIYLGQTQVRDTQGQTLLAVSDRVLGSHRPLANGAYGCQHPETVREHAGYVYWWDCLRGVVVRYANDGLTEISGYGLVGFFANRRRAELPAAPRPCAWYDALHKEYVLHAGTNRVEVVTTTTVPVRDALLYAPALADNPLNEVYPMTLANWLVAAGGAVVAGAVVAVLTQQYVPVQAPVAGTVTSAATPGAAVARGQVVATLITASGQLVRVLAPFAGTIGPLVLAVGVGAEPTSISVCVIEQAETPVLATSAGVLDYAVAPGQQLGPGELLGGITRQQLVAVTTNEPGSGEPGLGEVFCEATNRWPAFNSTYAEYALGAGTGVVSFNAGRAYLHDALPGDSANLLGRRYPAYVTLSANAEPSLVKVFETLALEGDAGWTAPALSTPEGQASHLDAEDFQTQEGKHYAPFLRDETTPNVAVPLFEGDSLRSTRLRLRLQHALGTAGAPSPTRQMRAATVGFVNS